MTAAARHRLGKRQLEELQGLGPLACPVVATPTHRRFAQLGLVEAGDDGSFVCLTPAGLRLMADEIEAGRMKPIRERMLAKWLERTAETVRKA